VCVDNILKKKKGGSANADRRVASLCKVGGRTEHVLKTQHYGIKGTTETADVVRGKSNVKKRTPLERSSVMEEKGLKIRHPPQLTLSARVCPHPKNKGMSKGTGLVR